MKMEHRVPSNVSYNMTGKLDPEYEAEVEKSTRKLEVEWEKAKRKLEAAERRAERALEKAERAKAKKARESAKKDYKKALVLVEERQIELRNLERLMTSTPAGSQHRGTKSYRPVPIKGKE